MRMHVAMNTFLRDLYITFGCLFSYFFFFLPSTAIAVAAVVVVVVADGDNAVGGCLTNLPFTMTKVGGALVAVAIVDNT